MGDQSRSEGADMPGEQGQTLSRQAELPSIPGYAFERQIGRGGSATVYLAREHKHDRLVAVKLLHPALAASIQAERFLREISIVARLAHPNILPLLDSGSVGDQLYYVTPYVAGESLRKWLERDRRLSVDDAVRLTKEVAQALDYAHRQGLVHRDVKPENILIADGHAFVADFGIARALSLAADDRLTTGGIALGTPRYMSPEQAIGRPDVDGRSDVYSLGCVLFEMLSGLAPFEGTATDVVAQHSFATVPTLRVTNTKIPEGVIAAVRQAMAKLPHERHGSAAAFALALDATELRWRSPSRLLPASLSTRLAIMMMSVIVIVIASATWVGLTSRETASPSASAALDTTRLAIISTGDGVDRAHSRTSAAGLYEAIAGWGGLNLVDQFLVTDALDRLRGPVTLQSARQLASSLGAGRFILVRSERVGDSVRLDASLYDVTGRSSLFRLSESFREDGSSDQPALARAAQRLLLRGASGDSSNATITGSRSLPAVQAFSRAQDSLSRWNLSQAEAAFEEALEFDANYARANLWLAQVKAWRGRPTNDWYKLAERAVIGGSVFSHRERLLASALVSLSSGKFAEACGIYEELRNANDRDFGAWYGLGQCRSMDNAVIRDSRSPSGWRMRSSHRAGVEAYERALDLLPSAYAGYEHEKFEGLRRLLSIRTGLLFARALAPDTGRFWGRVSLLNDTLALIPYPWSVVALGGPASIPPGFMQAQASRIAYFKRLADGWSSAFPNRAGPKHAVALALEMSGDARAIDTLGIAGQLVTDSVRKVALTATQILLRVKFGTSRDATWWRAIAKSADSLLRNVKPSTAHALALTPIAALLGRCDDAVAWSRFRPGVTVPSLSQGLVDAADLHAIRVSIGCSPGTNVPSLGALVQLVASDTRGLGTETRRFVTAMVLQRPTTLSWPMDSTAVDAVARDSNEPLVHALRFLARGDTGAARGAMNRFETQYTEELGTTTDVGYPAARVYLALGDSAMAVLQLDRALSALSTSNPGALNDPIVTGTLIRSMALRAELARSRREPALASQFSEIVSVLWSTADREPHSVGRRLSR